MGTTSRSFLLPMGVKDYWTFSVDRPRRSLVTGPLAKPVRASWALVGSRAVIESARACGIPLVGGPATNDPVAATTRGVGELIGIALEQGASEVVVGLGGSATTDGGLGAIRALENMAPVHTGPSNHRMLRRDHLLPGRRGRLRTAEGRHPGTGTLLGRTVDGRPCGTPDPVPSVTCRSSWAAVLPADLAALSRRRAQVSSLASTSWRGTSGFANESPRPTWSLQRRDSWTRVPWPARS